MFGDGALEERVMELLGTKTEGERTVACAARMAECRCAGGCDWRGLGIHVRRSVAEEQTLSSASRVPVATPVLATGTAAKPEPEVLPQLVRAVAPVAALRRRLQGSAASVSELKPEQKAEIDRAVADAQREVNEAMDQLSTATSEADCGSDAAVQLRGVRQAGGGRSGTSERPELA